MTGKVLIPLFIGPSAPYISEKIKNEKPTVVNLKEDDADQMAAVAGQFLDACDLIITVPRNIAVSKSVANWSTRAKDNPAGPLTNFVGSGSAGEAVGALAAVATMCFALYSASSKQEDLERERSAHIGTRYQEIYDAVKKKSLPEGEGGDTTEDEGLILTLPEKYKEKYTSARLVQSTLDHSKFFLVLEPKEADVHQAVKKETPKSFWTPFADSIKKVDAVVARPISFLNTTFSLSSMVYWVIWYGAPTFITANQGTVGVIIGTGLLGTVLSAALSFVLPALIGLAFLSRVIFNAYARKKDLSVSEQKSLALISKFFFEPWPVFKLFERPVYNIACSIAFHILTLGAFYFTRTIIGGLGCIFSRIGYAVGDALKLYHRKKSRKQNSRNNKEREEIEMQQLLTLSPASTTIQEDIIVADKSLVDSSLDILKEIMVAEQNHLIMVDMDVMSETVSKVDKPLFFDSDISGGEFLSEVKNLTEPEKNEVRKELGLDRLNPSILGWIGIILGAFVGGWVSTHNNVQFSEWFASDFSRAVHISSNGVPSSWTGAMGFIGIFIFVAAVVYGIRSLVIKTTHVQKAKADLLTLEEEKDNTTLQEIYRAVHHFKQYKKWIEERQATLRTQIAAKNSGIDNGEPECYTPLSADDYLKMPKALSEKIDRIITPTDFGSKFKRFFGYFFLGILSAEGAFFVWRVLSYVGGGTLIFSTIALPPGLAIWLSIGLALGVIYATLRLWNYARDQEAGKGAAIVSDPQAFLKYVKDTQQLLEKYNENVNLRIGIGKKTQEEAVVKGSDPPLTDEQRKARATKVPPGLGGALGDVLHPDHPVVVGTPSTALREPSEPGTPPIEDEDEGAGEKPKDI